MEWYHEHLKPIMAEWAYLWLQSVHLHGATRSETISYILNGASARSDSGRRLELLTSERLRLEAKLGIRTPGPTPSLTLQRSISEEKKSDRQRSDEALRRQISDNLSEKQATELKKELDMIIQVQAQTQTVFDLINRIYDSEAKIEEQAEQSAKSLAKIDEKIATLKSKIDAIENPHDDSLDNTVVIWVSKHFLDEDTCRKYRLKPDDAERKMVNTNIGRLEAKGLIVRRVESSDEALDMARSTLKQGRLRCVVTDCKRSKVDSGLTLVKDLVSGIPDTGNSKVLLKVPTERICVFDVVDVRSKEARRLKFWKRGIQVMNDSDQLISFVNSIPFWPDQIKKREENEKNEKKFCSGTVVVFDNKEKDVEIEESEKMKRVILWIVKNERDAAENVTQFELLKKEYDDVVVVQVKNVEAFLREMPSNMKLVSVVIEAAPKFQPYDFESVKEFDVLLRERTYSLLLTLCHCVVSYSSPKLKPGKKCKSKESREILKKKTIDLLKSIEKHKTSKEIQEKAEYFTRAAKWNEIDPDMKTFLDTYRSKERKKNESSGGRVRGVRARSARILIVCLKHYF